MRRMPLLLGDRRDVGNFEYRGGDQPIGFPGRCRRAGDGEISPSFLHHVTRYPVDPCGYLPTKGSIQGASQRYGENGDGPMDNVLARLGRENPKQVLGSLIDRQDMEVPVDDRDARTK